MTTDQASRPDPVFTHNLSCFSRTASPRVCPYEQGGQSACSLSIEYPHQPGLEAKGQRGGVTEPFNNVLPQARSRRSNTDAGGHDFIPCFFTYWNARNERQDSSPTNSQSKALTIPDTPCMVRSDLLKASKSSPPAGRSEHCSVAVRASHESSSGQSRSCGSGRLRYPADVC